MVTSISRKRKLLSAWCLMLHIGIILNDVHLSWILSLHFILFCLDYLFSLSLDFPSSFKSNSCSFCFHTLNVKQNGMLNYAHYFYLGKSVNYRHAMHNIRIVRTTCTIELEIYLCYYHPSKWFVLETVYRYMCFRRHLYCQSWIMIENTQW